MRMNVVFLNVSGCDSEIQNFGIKCLKKTTLEFPVLIYKVLHHGKKTWIPNIMGLEMTFLLSSLKLKWPGKIGAWAGRLLFLLERHIFRGYVSSWKGKYGDLGCPCWLLEG